MGKKSKTSIRSTEKRLASNLSNSLILQNHELTCQTDSNYTRGRIFESIYTQYLVTQCTYRALTQTGSASGKSLQNNIETKNKRMGTRRSAPPRGQPAIMASIYASIYTSGWGNTVTWTPRHF